MSSHRMSTGSTETRKAVKPQGSARTPANIGHRRKVSAATPVTHQERYQLIAEAAYFIAERRSFAPGSELDDWFEAEAEIARRLGEIAPE